MNEVLETGSGEGERWYTTAAAIVPCPNYRHTYHKAEIWLNMIFAVVFGPLFVCIYINTY